MGKAVPPSPHTPASPALAKPLVQRKQLWGGGRGGGQPGLLITLGECSRSVFSPASVYLLQARRGGRGKGSKTPRRRVKAVPTLRGAGAQDGHVSQGPPEALCPVLAARAALCRLPSTRATARPPQASGSGVRLRPLPSHGTFLADRLLVLPGGLGLTSPGALLASESPASRPQGKGDGTWVSP